MKRKVVVWLVILISLSGCITVEKTSPQNGDYDNRETTDRQPVNRQPVDSPPQEPVANSDTAVRSIDISGVESERTIGGSTPVEIVASGVENQIIVRDGTPVRSVILSGIDNQVELPNGVSPSVTRSGVDNQITYRR